MRRTKTVKANGETVLGQWENWIPVGSDIDAEFRGHKRDCTGSNKGTAEGAAQHRGEEVDLESHRLSRLRQYFGDGEEGYVATRRPGCARNHRTSH